MISLLNANALNIPLANESVDMCVTSPPYYGLRDYGEDGQLGLEDTPEQYIENMVSVFREVWRVMKPHGTLWLNIGDSYAGSGKGAYADGVSRKEGAKQKTNKGSIGLPPSRIDRSKRTATRWGGRNIPASGDLKPKDLIGAPWMLAFALRADGWYLRTDII